MHWMSWEHWRSSIFDYPSRLKLPFEVVLHRQVRFLILSFKEFNFFCSFTNVWPSILLSPFIVSKRNPFLKLTQSPSQIFAVGGEVFFYPQSYVVRIPTAGNNLHNTRAFYVEEDSTARRHEKRKRFRSHADAGIASRPWAFQMSTTHYHVRYFRKTHNYIRWEPMKSKRRQAIVGFLRGSRCVLRRLTWAQTVHHHRCRKVLYQRQFDFKGTVKHRRLSVNLKALSLEACSLFILVSSCTMWNGK